MQISGSMEFIKGVVRSFISTGCMPIHSDDPTITEFLVVQIVLSYAHLIIYEILHHTIL